MIELKNIYKTYKTKQGVTFRALEDINLKFASKGLVFILGKSGSGKSTLLNLIGALDRFNRGEIIVDDKSFNNLTSSQLDYYRSTYLGFIFQDFHLIKSLTVYDNIKMALSLQNDLDVSKIDKIMARLSILELKNRKGNELSGGQKQRVAIARALVKNPQVILADEPTGSLDSKNSEEIFKILKELSTERLVIVVSHDDELAKNYADRIIEVKDGQIYKDIDTTKLNDEDKKDSVSFISSNIIKVETNGRLNENDKNKLNKIISSDKRDSYISFEVDQTKVKSMFPHLKETIESNDKEKEIYRQYKHLNEPSKTLNLVKTKLRFLDSIKLGFNNLFVKKFNLVLLLLITTLSLTLFGLSDDLASFDMKSGITNTLKRFEKPYVNISDSASSLNSPVLLNKIDLINIEKEDGSFTYLKSYRYPMSITYDNNNPILIDSISGFIELKSANNLNYNYLSLNDNPLNNYNHIIISSMLADSLITNNYQNILSYNELLGKSILLNQNEYFIDGVYDSNSEKYDSLKYSNGQSSGANPLLDEFLSEVSQHAGRIFVKEGFASYLAQEENHISDYNLKLNDKYIYLSELIKYETIPFEINVHYFENGVLGLNEFLISYNLLNQLIDGINIESENDFFLNLPSIEEKITQFNALNNNFYLSESNNLKINYVGDNITIKGIVLNQGNFLYSSSSLIETAFTNQIALDQVLVENTYFKNNTEDKVNMIMNNNLKINELFVSEYENAYQLKTVFSSLLNALSLALAIIVIILFYNFIQNSIRSSKKQIGILRALGAKKTDIIKIYILESLLVVLLSSIICIGTYYISSIIINISFSASSQYYLGVISFRLNSIFKMFYLMAIVFLISLILPFYRLLKITPVEAINDK